MEIRDDSNNENCDFSNFSIINPQINKTFYYCKNYFIYTDLKTDSRIDYLIKQENKFLQLIKDTARKEKLSVWLNLISWIKSVLPKDKMREFILLDIFTQITQSEEMFYKEEEYILLWMEYSEMCQDEVKVYQFMLDKGIFSHKNSVIDRILNYYCIREDFISAMNIIGILCKKYKEGTKRKFYDKLKIILEKKISDYFASSVLFPDVINNFLHKKLGITIKQNSEGRIEDKENVNFMNIIQCSSNIRELNQSVEMLIRKYTTIKQFLMKYDEDFNRREELKLPEDKLNKPSSWFNNSRIKTKISSYLMLKTLSYMKLSDFYNNCIESLHSSLAEYALCKTEYLPRRCKLEFVSEDVEKDCCEYMFKLGQMVFSKYDKENYSTKISIVKFVNSNHHIRSISINYAVKNLIYLHGVNEHYIGLFTPFYFILFDTKTLTFVCRFRFEINHFTEENAVMYIFEYNPRLLIFSITNVIYILLIDNRLSISINNKLEGQKDDITKLSYNFLEGKHLLISSSKTQIVIWDLDSSNVYKIFSIDESKLLIKQLLLINLNALCIMTVYNQMYILEFAESNIIRNVVIKNFSEEESVFDIMYDKSIITRNDYIFKLNNKNLSIYDCLQDKELIRFFNEEKDFKNQDLIFVYENLIFKKCSKKNKVYVYVLY